MVKVEAHFSDEQDQKLLSLYETMYVERALRSLIQSTAVTATSFKTNPKSSLSPFYLSANLYTTLG